MNKWKIIKSVLFAAGLVFMAGANECDLDSVRIFTESR